MIRTVFTWLLLGALGASATLNAYQAGIARSNTGNTGTINGTPLCTGCGEISKLTGQPMCRLVDTVGLTLEQKRRFASCCPPQMQRGAMLNQRVNALIAELEKVLADDQPDLKRLRELSQQIGEIRAQELNNRIDSILVVRETLTPNQLKRLVRSCNPS